MALKMRFLWSLVCTNSRASRNPHERIEWMCRCPSLARFMHRKTRFPILSEKSNVLHLVSSCFLDSSVVPTHVQARGLPLGTRMSPSAWGCSYKYYGEQQGAHTLEMRIMYHTRRPRSVSNDMRPMWWYIPCCFHAHVARTLSRRFCIYFPK